MKTIAKAMRKASEARRKSQQPPGTGSNRVSNVSPTFYDHPAVVTLSGRLPETSSVLNSETAQHVCID
jgi:hypothetical protein